MTTVTELIHNGTIAELLGKQQIYTSLKTLVLDTDVSCEELNSLSKSTLTKNIEYLTFFNLNCNEVTGSIGMFKNLEKLIINSNTLDHFPEVLLTLPKLKHLQLDLMDFREYKGAVPEHCTLEEIEFQSTPVMSLGNLSKVPSLKLVGIIDNEKIKVKNENIKVVYH